MGGGGANRAFVTGRQRPERTLVGGPNYELVRVRLTLDTKIDPDILTRKAPTVVGLFREACNVK